MRIAFILFEKLINKRERKEYDQLNVPILKL